MNTREGSCPTCGANDSCRRGHVAEFFLIDMKNRYSLIGPFCSDEAAKNYAAMNPNSVWHTVYPRTPY